MYIKYHNTLQLFKTNTMVILKTCYFPNSRGFEQLHHVTNWASSPSVYLEAETVPSLQVCTLVGVMARNGLSPALHVRIAHTSVSPVVTHNNEGTRLHGGIGQFVSFGHVPQRESLAVDNINVTFLSLATWIRVVVQESVRL